MIFIIIIITIDYIYILIIIKMITDFNNYVSVFKLKKF